MRSLRADAWLLTAVLIAVMVAALWLIPKPDGCYRPDLDRYVPCETTP